MRFKQVLFLLYIFLLPIDGTNYINFYIGFIHISILDLLLVLMLYIISLEGFYKGFKVPFFITKITVLLLLASVISLISLAYIPKENIGFDIKLSLNMLEFAALIFIASNIINDGVYLKKVLITLSLSVTIISVATMLKSIGFDIPGDVRGESRAYVGPFFIGVTGITRAGMGFSSLVLAAFPLVLNERIVKYRFVRIVIISVMIIAAIIAFSRSLWVGMCIQFVLYMSLFQMMKRSLLKRLIVSLIIVGSLLLLLLYWQSIFASLVEIRPSTVRQRIDGYFDGLHLVISSPKYFLFGYGLGAFVLQSQKSVLPHNFLLEMIISKGFIVLSIVIFVFYTIIAYLLRALKDKGPRRLKTERLYAVLSIIVLTGYFGFGMFAPLFGSLAFWSMVAVSCSVVTILYISGDNGRNEGTLY